ncbi:unnamed protein product [Prunus armeniaca]
MVQHHNQNRIKRFALLHKFVAPHSFQMRKRWMLCMADFKPLAKAVCHWPLQKQKAQTDGLQFKTNFNNM